MRIYTSIKFNPLCDTTNATYDSCVFTGELLSRCTFRNCVFTNCSFMGESRDAAFVQCEFNAVVGDSSRFIDGLFSYCSFRECGFGANQEPYSGTLPAKLPQLFLGCMFREVSFAGCALSGASFEDSRFNGVDFQDCDLTHTKFTGSAAVARAAATSDPLDDLAIPFRVKLAGGAISFSSMQYLLATSEIVEGGLLTIEDVRVFHDEACLDSALTTVMNYKDLTGQDGFCYLLSNTGSFMSGVVADGEVGVVGDAFVDVEHTLVVDSSPRIGEDYSGKFDSLSRGSLSGVDTMSGGSLSGVDMMSGDDASPNEVWRVLCAAAGDVASPLFGVPEPVLVGLNTVLEKYIYQDTNGEWWFCPGVKACLSNIDPRFLQLLVYTLEDRLMS